MDMFRGRGFSRGGAFVDFFLVAVLLVLAYVFVVRRNYMGKVDVVVKANLEKNVVGDSHFEQMQKLHAPAAPPVAADDKGSVDDGAQHLIDVRVKKIPDSRPRECRGLEHSVKDQVSIIIDFFDYQLYDLKVTISSIIHNTPRALLSEIIIIDDGSTLDYILKDAKTFISKIDKAKLLSTKVHEGQAKARLVGLKQATSDIVVFLDSTVICNQGWLEPLLEQLRKEKDSLAVPHYDSIQDPVSYEYKATSDKLVSTFSWSLSLRMVETSSKVSVTESIPSHVVRGNAFAVRKDFLEDHGSFDPTFEEIGGEYLELSLRVWICGGSINIVPCSRVGLLNLHDPVKIGSPKNIRRISELWLGDRKSLVYKYTKADKTMSPKERDLLGQRQTALQGLKCKDLNWFLQNVANDIPTPPMDAKHYGLMKCRTGRCARVGKDARIDLGTCTHDKYNLMHRDMLFAFGQDGTIKSNDLCLTTKESAYIVMEPCKDKNNQQLWVYEDDHILKNVWSGFCAMHVTDPDKKTTDGTRQITMAQDCKTDQSGGDFVTWDFITP